MAKLKQAMADVDIKEAAKEVVETIHRPSGLATGDAISTLISIASSKYPNIDAGTVIEILQNAGFSSADGLKDFINTQIKNNK